MSELVGYARVSTNNQVYSLQVDQLKNYGCTKISHKKKTGKNTGRSELHKALDYLRPRDKLVVYKME